MRSRERLIEVMRTVNRHVYREASVMLSTAANHLEASLPCWACKENMKWLVNIHPSPHIHELAIEALHYLNVLEE